MSITIQDFTEVSLLITSKNPNKL